MPEIRLRSKHQITLPANVVRAAKLKVGDRMHVEFVSGIILIKLQKTTSGKSGAMAFAGIGDFLWGKNSDEIDQSIQDLRGS